MVIGEAPLMKDLEDVTNVDLVNVNALSIAAIFIIIMIIFKSVDKDSGAPAYIVFNDHMIEPAAAAHFHLKMSNESFMRLSTRKLPGPRSSLPI